MANKRQLKKAIQFSCGEMAGECFFASCAFGPEKIDQWDEIITDIALLQQEGVNRVSIDFDKCPKDFPNRKEYNKAKRAYFKQAEKALAKFMREETAKIVERMNALLPKK